MAATEVYYAEAPQKEKEEEPPTTLLDIEEAYKALTETYGAPPWTPVQLHGFGARNYIRSSGNPWANIILEVNAMGFPAQEALCFLVNKGIPWLIQQQKSMKFSCPTPNINI